MYTNWQRLANKHLLHLTGIVHVDTGGYAVDIKIHIFLFSHKVSVGRSDPWSMEYNISYQSKNGGVVMCSCVQRCKDQRVGCAKA